MIWGAVAQSAPDIDFLASFWTDTASDLLAHRGFTHSILCALLLTPLFAFSADRWHRPHNIRFHTWILFFGLEVFGHIFLDGFNNYGVGWFEPFSHVRFSFNALYVADPFFSVWVGVATILMVVLHNDHRHRLKFVRWGLLLSGAYFTYCMFNKVKIDREVNIAFEKQHIPHEKYFTTPTALNNWLWYVVSGNDSGYYVGYRSVFDRDKKIDFHFFPRNEALLAAVEDHEELQKLKRFSQGFYTVEMWHDTLVFNDLRFGQIVGWENPDERFVFHYFLQHPKDNNLVVQRGRFAKWDKKAVAALLTRIAGN